MEVILFLWIAMTVAFGFLGSNKKVGYWGAFWLSLLFSPIVSLFVSLVSSPKEPPIFINQVNPNVQPIVDKADQIAKYKKLLDEGAITQVEFDTQKSKILG